MATIKRDRIHSIQFEMKNLEDQLNLLKVYQILNAEGFSRVRAHFYKRTHMLNKKGEVERIYAVKNGVELREVDKALVNTLNQFKSVFGSRGEFYFSPEGKQALEDYIFEISARLTVMLNPFIKEPQLRHADRCECPACTGDEFVCHSAPLIGYEPKLGFSNEIHYPESMFYIRNNETWFVYYREKAACVSVANAWMKRPDFTGKE